MKRKTFSIFIESTTKLDRGKPLWRLSNKFLKGLSIKFQRVKPTENLGMSQIKPKDKTTTMKASQRLSEQW